MHIMKAIKRGRKSTNINYNLDESLKYSVKWKKSGEKKTSDCIISMNTYIMNSVQANSQRQKADQGLTKEGELGSDYLGVLGIFRGRRRFETGEGYMLHNL